MILKVCQCEEESDLHVHVPGLLAQLRDLGVRQDVRQAHLPPGGGHRGLEV